MRQIFILSLLFLIASGKLAAAVDKQQILKVLHPKYDEETRQTGRAKDEELEHLILASPAFLPDQVLAIEVITNEFSSVFLSLLKQTPKGLVLISRVQIVEAMVCHGNGLHCEFSFDFANYKLNQKERAFGVCVHKDSYGSDMYHDISSSVKIFRATPSGLIGILDLIKEHKYELMQRDETGIFTSMDDTLNRVIVVEPNKHKGNHDWLVKTTTKKLRKPWKRCYEPKEVSCEEGSPRYVTQRAKVSIRWDGNRYVPTKPFDRLEH